MKDEQRELRSEVSSVIYTPSYQEKFNLLVELRFFR